MKLFFIWILAIFVSNVKGNFDEVIQMQQIILTVEHNGRHLNVWRETKEAISRFYVTPLCELISTSIKCAEDDVQTKIRHRLMFQVRVWDNAVAEKIQQELKNILGIDAVATNILPLPMQQFRLSIKKDSANAYVEHGWRSNLNQPRIIQFEIFTDSAEFCYKMKEEAIYNVELFLAKYRLVFEFSMMVGQQETRNLNITGSIVSKSSFFAKLKNHIDKEGNVYLTSDDLNDFSRDIFHTAITYEQITSAYIPSEQEDSFIKEMVNIFKEHRVQASNFTSNEWDSVFWDDIFTRPDVMTEYLNEVFTHKEGTDNFKFDELKDGIFSQKIMDKYQEQQKKSSSFKVNVGLSMGGKGTEEPFKLDFGIENNQTKENGKGGEHEEDKNNSDKYFISKDALKSVIDKFGSNVYWTGAKFEQKPISLYRVNTRALQSAGQILYSRVVLTKLNSIAAIEIRPEMTWHIPQSTRTPPKNAGRPSILLWPSDLIPIQERVFSEGLDNEKTAKKIHEILSENYPRDKYFVAVWTRKSEKLLEEARLFSKPEIVNSVNLWEHEPIVAPTPVEENPPARRKRNVLPKRTCLIYRSTMSDYTGAMKIFEESQNKVPKILPNFNATMDVWRVLKPVFNEYFSFMALIQWHTDLHATWYNSGEGMNVNDKYLLFVGFD